MRRTWMAAGLGGILLVGGGAVAGVAMYRDGIAAHVAADARTVAADVDEVPDELVRQAEPLYYSFSPPFTVNVKETAAFIQAGVSISTHYATTVDNVKNDDPALRSAIMLALSDASEASAATDAGKRALEARVADAINGQLRRDGYAAGVDAAYFTDFIIQGRDDE